MAAAEYARALAAKDVGAIRPLLATEVEFHSPIIAAPGFEGVESVMELFAVIFREAGLIEVLHVLGEGEVFAVAVETTFEGRAATVLQLVQLDGDGLIADISLTSRPLTGTAEITRAIGGSLLETEAKIPRVVARGALLPVRALAVVLNVIGGLLISRMNRRLR